MEPELFFPINLQNLSIINFAKRVYSGKRNSLKTYLRREDLEPFINDSVAVTRIITTKVDKYQMQNTLKNKITNALLYMFREFDNWRIDDDFIFNMFHVSSVVNSLEWTYKGKVDIAKTVTNLLNNDLITLYDQFRLSCRFCVEDKVVKFGKVLSKKEKKRFQSVEKGNEVMSYWMYHLKWDKSMDFTDERKLVECVKESLEDKNILAVEYFYNKLSSQSQEFVCSFLQNKDIFLPDNILRFFFSKKLINKTDMLQTRTSCMFKAILKNCMWNQNFSFVLNSYKQFLDEEEVSNIVDCILDTMEYYSKLNDLQDVFRELHHLLPTNLNSTMQLHRNLHLLCKLKDKVSINMMLNELEFEHKQYFLLEYVHVLKNYDMIKFVIDQVYKTDDEVAKLKNEFLSLQEDSNCLIVLGAYNATVFEMIKDKVSLSEDEWEQFNLRIEKYLVKDKVTLSKDEWEQFYLRIEKYFLAKFN